MPALPHTWSIVLFPSFKRTNLSKKLYRTKKSKELGVFVLEKRTIGNRDAPFICYLKGCRGGESRQVKLALQLIHLEGLRFLAILYL